MKPKQYWIEKLNELPFPLGEKIALRISRLYSDSEIIAADKFIQAFSWKNEIQYSLVLVDFLFEGNYQDAVKYLSLRDKTIGFELRLTLKEVCLMKKAIKAYIIKKTCIGFKRWIALKFLNF